MPQIRVSQASELLQVSDDTIRRWAESGKLGSGKDESGRMTVASEDVAALMAAASHQTEPAAPTSARNRFAGIITRVEKDGVMALVEIQAGPHRVTSLMSREAAEELGLEPGKPAAAVVKATNVIVESM